MTNVEAACRSATSHQTIDANSPPTGLMMHFYGVVSFQEQHLTKSQIPPFLVPVNVSGFPSMVRFDEFVETPSPGPDDARSENRPYTGIPHDPLTIGRRAGDQ